MKKKLSRNSLINLVILLGLVVPLIALIATSVHFESLYSQDRQAQEAGAGEMVTPESETVTPSQVLANRSKYADQSIIVRGKVSPESVVCERRTCPEDDPCCGCPSQKSLIVSDADIPLFSEKSRQLLFFGARGEPFCSREQGSCDYNCPGWQTGKIYDLEGVFFAEPPIAGSGSQVWESYFEVASKNLVPEAKAPGFIESISGNIKELIKLLKTSGYYIR